MISNSKNHEACDQLIESYFNNDAEPTLERFLNANENQIIAMTKLGEDIKTTWTNRYIRQATRRKATQVIGEPDWGKLALATFQKYNTSGPSISQQQSSSTASPSTSEKSSQGSSNASKKPITAAMIEKYFEPLLDGKKWTLNTGKVVEDTMKLYAVTLKFEHPVHSLVLDVDDKMWVRDGYFTEEEMEEIKDTHCPKDPELFTHINEYLNGYVGKNDLDSIFDHANHSLFHPKREPDLFWMHQAFIKTLNLFYSNYLPITDNIETDILNRVWGIVQECFDVSHFKVRGGEKTSSGSSEAKNASRSLSGEESIARKSIGKKVDLLFKSGSNEYGCAEAGKQTCTDTTKELLESSFTCPKTLRDIMMKLGEVRPNKLHELVTVGFVFSGLQARFLLMTCPKGYVCRLQTLGPLSFPESESNLVARLSSILIVVWRMKMLLEETWRIVNDEERFVPTMKNPTRKSPIDSAFHYENYASPKKRKTSASNCSSNTGTTDNSSEA